MDTPTVEPLTIYQGDSATWKKSAPGYPAGDGWSLRYDLNGPAEETIQITSSASGDTHLIGIASATTALWTAGSYTWACRAIKDTARYTIATGTIVIQADPAAGSDSKPHCKIVLDLIEAVIEGRATHDQLKYNIDGTTVERMDIDQLLKLRRRYKNEWERYLRKQQGKTSRLIKARFS